MLSKSKYRAYLRSKHAYVHDILGYVHDLSLCLASSWFLEAKSRMVSLICQHPNEVVQEAGECHDTSPRSKNDEALIGPESGIRSLAGVTDASSRTAKMYAHGGAMLS